MIWVAKNLYFFNCLLDGAHTNVIVASLFLTESGNFPVSIAKSNKQWGNLL